MLLGYNTSGDLSTSFLNNSVYYIDWGDGSSIDLFTNQTLTHNYSNTPSGYTITFSGQNTWGVSIIQKEIILPLTGATITNLDGTFTFIPQSGNWSGIPTTYDFIFTGDSQNNYPGQISSSYVPIPFPVSGYTYSKLKNLKRYGSNPYTVGYQFFKNNDLYGQIDDINNDFIEYTINGIKYYDLNNGKTLFVVESSGFTQNDLVLTGLTKDERLMDFVFDPEIQSDVFIERGKYSAF